MNIRLRTMTAQEYNDFYEYSKIHHADELMKELHLSFDEAIQETENELKEMLPDGQDTKDNFLMVIEDAADHRTVGFIWYLFELTDNVKQAFLCDFVIYEPERRKGYAAAALSGMEQRAKKHGCQKSVLFVADDNSVARNLYAKCGYVFLKKGDCGSYLKKKLCE